VMATSIVRSGTTLLYTLQPGEKFTVRRDGVLVVTHEERTVKLIHPDGRIELLPESQKESHV